MGLVTQACPRDPGLARAVVTGFVSATSGLQRTLLAQQTSGTEAENEYQQQVHGHVRPVRGEAPGEPHGEPHQEPRDDRTPEAADATEHDDQERRDHGIDADVRSKPPDRGENDARHRSQRGAEREYEEAKTPDVDAERAHHLAVVSTRFDPGSVRRFFQEDPHEGHQNDTEDGGEEAVFGIDDIARENGTVHRFRYREVLLALAPHDANSFFEDQRRAEGEEQAVFRFLTVGAAHRSLQTHSHHADHERRQNQSQRVSKGQRDGHELGSETAEPSRIDDLHRDVCAQREERTVREIDDLHDSHDEHEAERDDSEEDAERDSVDQVRKQIHDDISIAYDGGSHQGVGAG